MLWREVIEIPEQVHSSDFVLKLTDGVTGDEVERTVGSYVVTKGVAHAFEQALGLIGSSLKDKRSKAAYLHGSFGSGKSHFMAVLDLLLTKEHSPVVRRLDRLVPVISKHTSWLDERKLLMVPYHFLGAQSMEERILGGYVAHVRKLHPAAPVPGVYASESLIQNAQQLRAQLGDVAFFKMLNADEGEADSPWFSGWDMTRFEAALESDPASAERSALVGTLVSTVFTSMQDMAGTSEGAFVDLDTGLQIITRHAKGLGYDGLVLFLDELILWLSRYASDLKFIHREEQKLAKLVESQSAGRPIPIISFVARQRALSEFVGDHYTGAERSSFELSLGWLEGRFDTINLEDRDLPLIAQERLLKPKSEEGSLRVKQSFERYLKTISSKHRDLMRTKEMDDEQFSKVYPFSPALVQALVALSTFLQRERTALRLLLLLLVKHRDRLRLGEVVPVGDLWDVVTEGQQPFSPALRRTYQNAVELWEKKLKPMLINQHGFDPEQEAVDQFKAQAFEDDARLLKTLLIAALVPQVEALKEMTISKLTALNLSAVRAPMPSFEEQLVFQKIQRWSSECGELRISQKDTDPTVQIQLTTLDPEHLLERVAAQDSPGSRRRKVRNTLYELMGISGDPLTDDMRYELAWRGAKRQFSVRYRNVHDLTKHEFKPQEGEWALVLDYPFDDQTFSPADDEKAIKRFLETENADTLVWLPIFLSTTGQQRLGRLVRVDYLLDHYDRHTEDLPQKDRPLMRQLLEGQRSALYAQLKLALEAAYGLMAGEQPDTIDVNNKPERHLHSLRLNHKPQLPGGQSFEGALKRVLMDALEEQYPTLARLPHDPLTPTQARKLLSTLKQVIASGQASQVIEDKGVLALCLQYAAPLALCEGKDGSNRIAPNPFWRDKIEREIGQVDRISVDELRRVIDPPTARTGIPPLLVDVIIGVYATLEQMALQKMNIEQELEPGRLDGVMVLVRRVLPDEECWSKGLARAEAIFGITQRFPLRDARNVEALAELLRQEANKQLGQASTLPTRLEALSGALGASATLKKSKRYEAAQGLIKLLKALKQEDSTKLIEQFVLLSEGDFALAAYPTQMRHLQDNLSALAQLRLVTFEQAGARAAEGLDVARVELERARQILMDAEHVRPLKALSAIEQQLYSLLIQRSSPAAAAPAPSSKAALEAGSVAAQAPTAQATFHIQSEAQLEQLMATLRERLNHAKGGLSVMISERGEP